MKKKWLVFFLLLCLNPKFVLAGGSLELLPGRLDYDDSGYPVMVITLANNSDETFYNVELQCVWAKGGSPVDVAAELPFTIYPKAKITKKFRSWERHLTFDSGNCKVVNYKTAAEFKAEEEFWNKMGDINLKLIETLRAIAEETEK